MVRPKLSSLLVAVARWLGSDLRDPDTGEIIGRAFLLPWRGRILVIGLSTVVRIEFRSQKRLTYWKQEIVFRTAERPDFPHEPGS